VGGNFYGVNGVKREYFARLLNDGSLDTTFDPGSAIINSVQSIAIQSNNKVLVGETVSRKINNVFPPSLVRLLSDDPPIPPVVTITATHPNAVEDGPNGDRIKGHFRITRTGDISLPLTVYLTLGGTAVNVQDYEAIKLKHYTGTIYRRRLEANVSSLGIPVIPTGQILPASPETVTLTLRPDQSGETKYTLGSQTSATVTLSNH
jgi:hypothetical protein